MIPTSSAIHVEHDLCKTNIRGFNNHTSKTHPIVFYKQICYELLKKPITYFKMRNPLSVLFEQVGLINRLEYKISFMRVKLIIALVSFSCRKQYSMGITKKQLSSPEQTSTLLYTMYFLTLRNGDLLNKNDGDQNDGAVRRHFEFWTQTHAIVQLLTLDAFPPQKVTSVSKEIHNAPTYNKIIF